MIIKFSKPEDQSIDRPDKEVILKGDNFIHIGEVVKEIVKNYSKFNIADKYWLTTNSLI